MWSTYTYISTLQDAVLGDPGWPESGSNSPDSSLSCAICLGKSLSHSDTSLAYLWNDDNRTHPIRLLCGLDTIIYVKHLHSAWHIVNTLCESPWLKHTQLINCEITLWATLHQEIALQGFKMQGFTYQNGTYLQNIFGIWPPLTVFTALILEEATIMPPLGYCKSLLIGLSACILAFLQSFLITAERLSLLKCKSDHFSSRNPPMVSHLRVKPEDVTIDSKVWNDILLPSSPTSLCFDHFTPLTLDSLFFLQHTKHDFRPLPLLDL